MFGTCKPQKRKARIKISLGANFQPSSIYKSEVISPKLSKIGQNPVLEGSKLGCGQFGGFRFEFRKMTLLWSNGTPNDARKISVQYPTISCALDNVRFTKSDFGPYCII